MVEEADQELQVVRVSFRWTLPQVAVIKRAATQFGIPYQAFIRCRVRRFEEGM